MTIENKKPMLLLILAVLTILRVYGLMAIDWTTVEGNEILSPIGLVLNVVLIIVILRLKRVE